MKNNKFALVSLSFQALLFEVEETNNGDFVDLAEAFEDYNEKALFEAARIAATVGIIEFTNTPTVVRVLDTEAASVALSRVLSEIDQNVPNISLQAA
jgi:hypothetical protein